MANEIIARRLRRVTGYSVAAVLPYVGFVILLIVSPATMGVLPLGGSLSLAIYFALFLFAWPIVIAILYLRGIADGVSP